jgi:hypothetical protein
VGLWGCGLAECELNSDSDRLVRMAVSLVLSTVEIYYLYKNDSASWNFLAKYN